MAVGTKQTNTTEELLRKLLPQLSEFKLADDPDWDFIGGLETAVIAKLREPLERVKAAGLTAAQPSMGGGFGVPSGPPPMPPAQGGLAPSMAPGGDELRRILNSPEMQV